MTYWILGSLLALSLLRPAFSASPAQMTVKVQMFSTDGGISGRWGWCESGE